MFVSLLLAGIVAGLVNFFTVYVDLPLTKPASLVEEEGKKLKDYIVVAILGYIVLGWAGAFLTPLLNEILTLKGLQPLPGANGKTHLPEFYDYTLFGYGLVFGYSTNKLLTSLLDALLKKVATLETKLAKTENESKAGKTLTFIGNHAGDIINECESQFETYKNDCSAFAKAVAAAFSINLTGQADDIADQLQQGAWEVLGSGMTAKQRADNGWFVIAVLKGADNVPPQEHGHVAIIVSGPIAQQKYPTGYWGRLGGIGEKNKTINWAWNAASRDKVSFAAYKLV